MVSLESLIQPAVSQLNSIGVETAVSVNDGLSPNRIADFEAEIGIRLPYDVHRLYSESNGFDVSWHDNVSIQFDDGQLDASWGRLQFPSICELRLYRQRWINGDMPNEEWTSHLSQSESDAVLKRMGNWLPFDNSGSGNLMCIDCENGIIVEYDHEWDCPTNGIVYADSLFEYFKRCTKLLFFSAWHVPFSKLDWESIMSQG